MYAIVYQEIVSDVLKKDTTVLEEMIVRKINQTAPVFVRWFEKFTKETRQL